jgi:sn-glycerol 3-phosphate transport system substrate-binding protein
MAIGNGQNVVGDPANKVTFNNPAVAGALQAWVDLGVKDKVAPASIVQWATAPNDFTAGKTGMLWHTTGSLTSILKDAKFPVGVGFLPGLKQNGTPTGGGNFYLFKKTPAEKQQAAWKFIQFMAGPEIQARWTVDTGYIAARKSAWDTATLKEYSAKVPQVLVARDQLAHAAKELSTHQGPQIQQLLGNQVQAALTGKKSAQQALEDAQKDADKLLSQFKD